jgi:hypothetical protein
MGAIYRATDSLSGQQVALKLLHADTSDALQRFSREAAVLAQLRHPGIVSYVAHGSTDDGRPFLVMQWLEGEDLAQRLARQPLSPHESLSLVRNVSQALALAHQHGVIHRDLKPSNLFLRNGRADDVVLLDFGLSRHLLPSTAITASQMLLGTPGYMAPEQVSNQSALTPSADVFSLGCVLYECLTGVRPFTAPLLVTMLAKILFAEPAPLHSLRPELPEALQGLLDRMLAKDPARRLPDASGLLGALEELQGRWETAPGATASPGAPGSSLGNAEQQLVTVLLAAPRFSATYDEGAQHSRQMLRDTLRTLLAPQGAQVELLADGALVLTLMATLGSATDPAALAARCALSLLERWPEAVVALATGRGSLSQSLPVGEAMDRAGQLLRQLELVPNHSAPVMLDEVTAGLLGPGFQLTRPQSGLFLLHGEQLGADASRPLLGKPTPCVGREQELALLHMAFTTCVEESTAQAVLVTAPAGVGKSRLRHEFLRRLERHEPPPLVLLARGDPMSAGSADGLLGQALRRLCGISGGEPLGERQARLSQHLSQHLPPAQAQEVVEFLGELCAIPFADEHSPRLRAARADPQVLSLQMGRAWVSFLKAACAHQPVLLVLEDLHWGDMLSLRLMEEALRALAEQPFMVLALARPEVEQLLPGPWIRRMQQVPMRGLSSKASARLVREVVGTNVPGALVDKLVEQAAGNALFLEELIRGVVEGRGEAPPETVLAMLQARLMRLEPQSRQVLLAASLFGRTFWVGGVRALLAGELSNEVLEHALRMLVEKEWVEPQPSSRFPGEVEYLFRHALVRDAAYGLVPDSHRPTGHQRVGTWLEQAGEGDLRVLAEHASQGQQPERAIHFHTRAAEQLLERGDMPGTVRCVEAALALGARGAEGVHLRALQATAAIWMGDLSKLYELGEGLLAELKPGSRLWCWLTAGLYVGQVIGGMHEQVARLGQELLRHARAAEDRVVYIDALGCAVGMDIWRGARREAEALLACIANLHTEGSPTELVERAWHQGAQASFSAHFEARPWQACVWAEQSYQAFLESGVERGMLGSQYTWGMALEALGDRATAETVLRQSVSAAQHLGQALPLHHMQLQLALLLAGSTEPARRQEALELASHSEADPIPRNTGIVHVVKARVAARAGDLAAAETEARKACELLASLPFNLLQARTLLSQVLLAQGRTAEARQEAALGVQCLEECGSEGLQAVSVRLALVEACLAEGETQAGEAALRRAVQCMRESAGDIPDAAARERFLRQVPENARTLELARQRWGD